MATDFSRIRSNPLLDYSGVQLKQGAVLLDADANELTAIFDRRLRALAGDVLGRATVGANTSDAFRITLGTTSSGAQTLNIGPGRLYVDGLLAENHGKVDPAGRVFDDLMGEERFTEPVPYEAQPYFPNPPPLPRAGRHLVYLDVWNREVTQLENPELVEPAVGVETGSRLQTVWQVRVLGEESGSAVTCGSPDADLPGWADVIAPSTGRLTTGTYEVAAVDDPCELPPTGGFRGLENQLYRVEIHDPGQPGGTATFKWSRDNASIGSRVVSLNSESELELESLGRDEVLRFNTGDFVEVLDDVREFAQLGGEMRSITVANATRRVTLSAPLPADMLPAGTPPAFPDSAFPKQRNLRVRLWSQRDVVLATASNGATTVFQDLSGTNGLIKVPAAGTTLLLENGVTVTFANVGQKGFRAGDYWVFAARTSDASVELLDKATPRGIHHHYARLSLWDAGANTEPTDCRHHWPPTGGGDDCACTQCVTPESHASGELTIEDAVNRVRETGGTVCLKAGQYRLPRAVPVGNARSVRITGEGINTMLLADAGAFDIDAGIAVSIENLAITTAGRVPAISVRSGYGISLHDLFITVANANVDIPASAVALSGLVFDLTICNNWITAPFGIRALDSTAREPLSFLWTANVRIEDNMLSCERQAIAFTGLVAHLQGTNICGNEISACREVGITMTGAAFPGSAVRITDNTLLVNGRGISCGTNFGWIEGNHVTATIQENRAPSGAGITIEAGVDPDAREQFQLLANQVDGFPDAGILINASVQDLICKLNIIRNCGNGIVTAATVALGSVSIENNHLRDIGAPHAPLQSDPTIYGISVRRAQTANVAGNQLQRVGIDAPAGIQRIAGIVQFAVRSSRVTNNDVAEVGPAAPSTAIISGIELQGPHEDHVVAGNQVARDPAGAIPDTTNFFALLVEEPSPPIPIIHVGNFTTVHLAAGRTLVLDGTHAFATEAVLDAGPVDAPLLRLSSVIVQGNVLRARGGTPAVHMITGLDIKFSDNRCTLNGNNTAVNLNCRVAVVSSNIVRGLGRNSVEVPGTDVQFTVVGNVTSGEILVRGQPLPTPWAPLNVRI
jgi:Family of unknown function (DUF6519)